MRHILDLRSRPLMLSWLTAWSLLSCTGSGTQNAGGGGTTGSGGIGNGGTTSSLSSQASGGVANGTAPADTYCNGMFASHGCPQFKLDSTTAAIPCDITLNSSILKVSATIVVLDCVTLDPTPTDAGDGGEPDGYRIDVSDMPAHLILLGATCDAVGTPGYHRIDVITGCGGPV